MVRVSPEVTFLCGQLCVFFHFLIRSALTDRSRSVRKRPCPVLTDLCGSRLTPVWSDGRSPGSRAHTTPSVPAPEPGIQPGRRPPLPAPPFRALSAFLHSRRSGRTSIKAPCFSLLQGDIHLCSVTEPGDTHPHLHFSPCHPPACARTKLHSLCDSVSPTSHREVRSPRSSGSSTHTPGTDPKSEQHAALPAVSVWKERFHPARHVAARTCSLTHTAALSLTVPTHG